MSNSGIPTSYLVFWDLWGLPEDASKQELSARKIGNFVYLISRASILPFIGFGRLLALFNFSENYFDADSLSFRESLLSGILSAIPISLFVLFIFRDVPEKYAIAVIAWPLFGLLCGWYTLYALRKEGNAI